MRRLDKKTQHDLKNIYINREIFENVFNSGIENDFQLKEKYNRLCSEEKKK